MPRRLFKMATAMSKSFLRPLITDAIMTEVARESTSPNLIELIKIQTARSHLGRNVASSTEGAEVDS